MQSDPGLAPQADSFASLLPYGHALAGAGLVVGAALVVVGLLVLWRGERRVLGDAAGGTVSAWHTRKGTDSDGNPPANGWWVAGVLALILLVATALRLYGLDAKTMTHTEAIVPNLVWPPDSWPPTRVSFYDTFWWHFHGEGHPQAFYFFMWAWTKVFGTTLASLRAPSAIFGVASVALVFVLGRLTYGRAVGLLASGLLAFHGLHIYFSQYSRMFMMASFLSLLSTVLLLKAVEARDRRLFWESSYVLISWVAIYSLTFAWTILATQVIWILLQRDLEGRRVQRLLTLQMVVAALGSPSLAHIVYRGDDVTLPGPSLSFAAEYLSFGFAFEPDVWSIPPRGLSSAISIALLAAAVLLLIVGATRSGRDAAPRAGNEPSPPPLGGPMIVAAGAASVIFGLTMVAFRHQTAMAVVFFLPFVAVLLPSLGPRAHRWLHGGPRPLIGRWWQRVLTTRSSISLLLATLPAVVIGALSFWTSMLTSRGFLIFVPFLLLVIGAGVMRLASRPLVTGGLIAALAFLGASSAVYWSRYPSEQFDYQDLAAQMNRHLRPGDLIFVPPVLWVVTPLYYHLGDQGQRYVTSDYDDVAAASPDQRVWLLYFDSYQWGEYRITSDEMLRAVRGYREAAEVSALRARARLMVPPDQEPPG